MSEQSQYPLPQAGGSKATMRDGQLIKNDRGFYVTYYRGCAIELIDLRQQHGAARTEWIAPIDGSNDIEPLPTRAEALAAAKRVIDLNPR